MTGPQTDKDFSWLLEDAKFLYQTGRKSSAILILLCTIDALARQADPQNSKSAQRFENFLRSKMRRPGRSQIHNILVPKDGKLHSFEYLIYKFLRCPLVHQGTQLDTNDPEGFAVCLDWDIRPHGLSIDQNRVVLGGEMVAEILADAIQDEIHRRASGSP